MLNWMKPSKPPGCCRSSDIYSKGRNLRSGATEQSIEIVHNAIRQGTIKKEDFLKWVAGAYECEIDSFAHNQLAIVVGNAPTHCRAKEIVEHNPGVQVIRLGSYNPALSGVEVAWSGW